MGSPCVYVYVVVFRVNSSSHPCGAIVSMGVVLFVNRDGYTGMRVYRDAVIRG